MQNNQEQFDVVVIGGGPAGILAAIRAAKQGANVALLEKNKTLGKKLLLTGKGRCNLTQVRYSNRDFIAKLGKNGRFVFSCLNVFGPAETMAFFEKMGLKTKIERGGRVFPIADRSSKVLGILAAHLLKNKVNLKCNEPVLGFETKKGKIENVILKNKKIGAKNFILCTGGKSYPETGSTGDGFSWAKSLGHKITRPAPALTPIITEEAWVGDAQGLSLKNVALNIFLNNKKKDSRFGEMLFTDNGLSGPIVIDASKRIGELLKQGEVSLEIDLKPALDFQKLDNRLKRDFAANPRRDFKNYLPDLLPKKLINTMIQLVGISPETKLNAITRQQRRKLLHRLKGLKLTAKSLAGFEKAVVTSGGVALKEIDPKTMRSRIIENLFFAGEIIDLDGPTGGYNLQICWSTAWAAGTWAAAGCDRKRFFLDFP